MVEYHKLLRNKTYNSFIELEKEISQLTTTKEKGDVFEQFVKLYFLLNKELYQIKEVYLFEEIPYTLKKQLKLEKRDYGVDGVLIFTNGKISTFQAKFRSNRVTAPYGELSTFLSESFKSDYKYIISNVYNLPIIIKKHNILTVLADTFDSLPKIFFDNLNSFVNSKKILIKKFSPRVHQERAINNILKGFSKNDRGKYISACGTGKTLTALWVWENMGVEKILFLVPSLALIKQTLEEWSRQTKKGFTYLCVCSDNTVSKDISNDDEDISINEIGVPVTTNKGDISAFINNNSTTPKIIFCTYQSLDVLTNSIKELNDFQFDLTFFDEAHRTVGIKTTNLFSLGLDNNLLRSKKRLFMTATEKMISPRIKKKLEDTNEIIFSMDDEEKYGPIFEVLNFGEAINSNIILDYKIVLAVISDEEYYNLISKNNYINVLQDEKEKQTTAQNIFRQILLARCINDYKLDKVITFHSNIKNSKNFILDSNSNINFKKIISDISKIDSNEIFLEHIDGTMSTGDRTKIFEEFKTSKIGVISNARCLTEGVDVPIIDSIYFVNPKHSLVDIVQACGRALRKGEGKKKFSYIIIPVAMSSEEDLNEDKFEILFYVLQALRDQDNRLADYIDKLNLHLASGGNIRNFSYDKNFSPLDIVLPKEFNLDKFNNSLHLKIVEKNANSTKYLNVIRNFQKGDLKSGYKRIFKTVGDYQFPGYKNLVDKTIKKFTNITLNVKKKELKIDNNNVSHTRRIGLIEENGDSYRLTTIGKDYYQNKIDFKEVFKLAMLSKEDIQFYPYISILKILLKSKSMNILQFLYGPYIMKDSSNEEIINVLKRIQELEKYKYNILVKNDSNRKKIFGELNKKYSVDFSDADLLMKTTAGNQFKYLAGHLSLFSDIVFFDAKNKSITIKDNKRLQELLTKKRLLL
jgi:predicted helicase